MFEPADEFGELAGQFDRLLPTSSRGSVVSIQAWASSDIATPAKIRSMPKRQVLWTKSTW